MSILKQVTDRFPNIEHDEDADEVTTAEQMANLAHRVYKLMELKDKDMPKTLIEFQVGIIYDRLESICEDLELEPKRMKEEAE